MVAPFRVEGRNGDHAASSSRASVSRKAPTCNLILAMASRWRPFASAALAQKLHDLRRNRLVQQSWCAAEAHGREIVPDRVNKLRER